MNRLALLGETIVMRFRILLLTAIACLTSSVEACSIPVFRYALEHWQPDPFMAAVFYRGELTAEQQTLLKKLEALDEEGNPTANVMVKAIDVENEANSGLLRLWELQGTETLPWIALHAPARSGPPQRIISGEFRAELVDGLLHSPARAEAAKRLIEGDSVVWVFLESGDAEADKSSLDMLTKELARLETTLRLPEIEEADFGDLSVVPESLRLAFSAISVSRDNVEESAFINMLMHAAESASSADSPTGPTAFPLFGRGRVLYELSGERLEPQSIEDACRFLTGPCQCTVKGENPGLDLLMAVDWEGQIEPAMPIDDSQPPLVGLGAFVTGATDTNSVHDTESDKVSDFASTDAATDSANEAASDQQVGLAPTAAPPGESRSTDPETDRLLDRLVRQTMMVFVVCLGLAAIYFWGVKSRL